MKFKKGDLSINMVIVAAIAIIVLLVVVMVFTGKFGMLGKTLESCSDQGGQCTSYSAGESCSEQGGYAGCKCGSGEIFLRGTDCEDRTGGEICCKKIY